MPIRNIEELNAMHIDVLTELGNIGSGNAVTSLSSFMGKRIDIKVPDVKILGFNEVAEYVGGSENVVMGLLVKIEGDIEGMIMYIFDQSFIKGVLETFFGKDFSSFSEINEMEISAFSEIGNIMAGSYVGAISDMTGLSINITSPSICIDMAGAILSVPSIEFARIGNSVLFIDDSFGIDGSSNEIKSNMILIPEMESLNKLFEKLGVM